MFTENPLLESSHVWKHHCDVIFWTIFMILVSMERGDPTLYHGTKQSYFGPVNFKFIRGVVTTPPLVNHVTKKGLVGWGLRQSTIKVLLTFSGTHSTTESTMKFMMTRVMSKVFRCSRNWLSRWSQDGFGLIKNVHHWFLPAWCVTDAAHSVPVEIFKSATFGERVSHLSNHLSRPFLSWIPCTWYDIKGQGFGNKMYSESSPVVGYFRMASFQNQEVKIFCAKCSIQCLLLCCT